MFKLYIYSPAGILEKILPRRVKSGYPVGCAIPSFTHTVASSPVSMKYSPGARVIRYTVKGIINASSEKNTLFLKIFNN
jgi:hypothetical protein